jgi:DNA-binding CsgD family transcriptional regulator
LNLREIVAGTLVAVSEGMTRRAEFRGGFPRRGARRPLDEKPVLGLEGGLRALALKLDRCASTSTVLEPEEEPRASSAGARASPIAANDNAQLEGAASVATSPPVGALWRKGQGSPDRVLAAPRGKLRTEQPLADGSVDDAPGGACRSVERVHIAPGCADGEFSVSLRRVVTSGRWTLVDTYLRDGEQYVVARCNNPGVPPLKPLSARERQALALAAHGNSNKVIAFEMGISASTVGVLLHRAAQKLRCRTRADLLAHFQQLAPGPSTAATPSDVRRGSFGVLP